MNHWSQSSYECARFLAWLDHGPEGPMERETVYAVLADLEDGKWDREYEDFCRGLEYDPDRLEATLEQSVLLARGGVDLTKYRKARRVVGGR